MKILITGSSGLLGSNIVEHFQNRPHELLTPKHKELDLLNREDVFAYLKANKPDCVIHAAAKVGSIAENVRYPLQFLTENLDMHISDRFAISLQDVDSVQYIRSLEQFQRRQVNHDCCGYSENLSRQKK